MDTYLGLGIKYRDVKHFDRKDPDDYLTPPRHPNIFCTTNLERKIGQLAYP